MRGEGRGYLSGHRGVMSFSETGWLILHSIWQVTAYMR